MMCKIHPLRPFSYSSAAITVGQTDIYPFPYSGVGRLIMKTVSVILSHIILNYYPQLLCFILGHLSSRLK